MKVLEVNNLSLGFNTEQGFCRALHGVNFALEEGKMLALVGESGCGKSVSAMSILRLLPKNAQITDGQILFKKQDLLTFSEKEMHKIRGARIALIPQDPMTSLNPLYTIGNQLLEVIEIHQHLRGDDAKKKALEALEMVQIPCAKERLRAYPHEFSGGMKQRAIIAMALACKAELLIADEPTTALDVTIQAQIMNLLAEIKRDLGTSILLITHDLALVGENADDIAVMYAGHVVESAPADEFFKHTNHPYSLALLNSIPSKRDSALETIQGQPPSIRENISGCRFHPRCSQCFAPCSITVPPDFVIGKNHISACFLNANN